MLFVNDWPRKSGLIFGLVFGIVHKKATERQTDKEKTLVQSHRYRDIKTKKHTSKETKGQTEKQKLRDLKKTGRSKKKRTFKIARRKYTLIILNTKILENVRQKVF